MRGACELDGDQMEPRSPKMAPSLSLLPVSGMDFGDNNIILFYSQ
jgi:hypothetical protein